MVRDYNMTRRSEAADETKRRIIDATHRLLDGPDGGEISLAAVAAEAGVSRPTVYNSVGSRSELLKAVLRDQGRVIGYASVLDALELPDPQEAVDALLKESVACWAVAPTAVRRTLALAVLDAEVGPIVERFEAYRRAEFFPLGARLQRAGLLRAGFDAESATDAILLLSSFPTWDLLQRHANASELADRLIALSRGILEP